MWESRTQVNQRKTIPTGIIKDLDDIRRSRYLGEDDLDIKSNKPISNDATENQIVDWAVGTCCGVCQSWHVS